jgi:hypothetical protein
VRGFRYGSKQEVSRRRNVLFVSRDKNTRKILKNSGEIPPNIA